MITLRRTLAYQIAALIVSLLLVTAAALWGLNSFRQNFGVALDGYQQLRSVYEVGTHVDAARLLLGGGSANRLRAVMEMQNAARRFDLAFPPESASDPGRDAAGEQDVRRALADATAANVDTLDSDRVNRVISKIRFLDSDIRQRIQQAQDHADAKRWMTIDWTAGLSGGVVALAILVGISQYRGVMHPLTRLAVGVKRVAAGRFTARVETGKRTPREFAALADDFNHMADELNGLYRDLRQQVEAKTKELFRSEQLASVGFLAAGVAHEINNPLGIIAAHAEFALDQLRRQPGAVTSEETQRTLTTICEEAFRCKSIVEKLLSLSRSPEEPRQAVELTALAREVVATVTAVPEYGRRKLAVESSDEGRVVASAGEIKQVVLNLLFNAMEATQPDKGEVTIAIARAGEWVELSVSDNGRGMSRETMDRVFEPFFTESPDDRRGTGLGLSITHAIVHRHGGTIAAYSDGEGKGSRFVVRLPAAQGVHHRHERRVGVLAHRLGAIMLGGRVRPPYETWRMGLTSSDLSMLPRVLIIDDEPKLREILVRAIASWGFDAVGARSAEEALRLMEADPADISILDLNLPSMAGIEVFAVLRERWPEHQVIILTGFGDLETAKAAIKLDVVDFLTKPCHLGELERALDRARRRLPMATPALLSDVPAVVPSSGETTLEAIEREHILEILRRHEGNRTATAVELGISRRTLQHKLSEYQRQGFAVG